MDKKKKLLLTGASGFLGRHIVKALARNYQIIGISRNKLSNTLQADLSKGEANLKGQNFDLVIHAAGKAHSIPKNREEAAVFFQVNHTGTVNLLNSLSSCSRLPRAIVFISTAAVYGSRTGVELDENIPLNATDPYGLSKIKAEEEVLAWGKEKWVTTAILRLPLVAGKNPPGNLGGMIKAIKKGYYFNIGNGGAHRSMVLAEDVSDIMIAAASTGGIYNLTDGVHPTYREISGRIVERLGKKKVFSIPKNVGRLAAFAGSMVEGLTNISPPFNRNRYLKLTSSLTFSDQKARKILNWHPRSVLDNIEMML